VEKGLGRVAGRALDQPEAVIMTNSWVWHDFLEAMKQGQVTESIRRIALAAGQPVTLEIRAAYADDTFQLQSEGDDLEVIQCPDMEELQSLASCTTITELGHFLGGFPTAEWIYIDCYLGINITLDPADKWSGEYWSPDDIWQRILLPWRSWLF